MWDFEPLEADNLGLDEHFARHPAPGNAHASEGAAIMQQESAFSFDSMHKFFSDPYILGMLGVTAVLAVLIPILSGIFFRYFYKMQNTCEIVSARVLDVANKFVDNFVEDKPNDTEELLFDDDEFAKNDNDFENCDPLDLSPEERILLGATMDADDPTDTNMLEALAKIKLHGKLASAQLRVKTAKMNEELSEEERLAEQKVKDEQLAKIYALMQENADKFGVQSENDLQEQLKLYAA